MKLQRRIVIIRYLRRITCSLLFTFGSHFALVLALRDRLSLGHGGTSIKLHEVKWRECERIKPANAWQNQRSEWIKVQFMLDTPTRSESSLHLKTESCAQ